uniref:Uncharacterized protein n=1 Tax=Cacopsylla melanoneura TaxID=428564 RepID=A0A8D8XAC1_9HEMI
MLGVIKIKMIQMVRMIQTSGRTLFRTDRIHSHSQRRLGFLSFPCRVFDRHVDFGSFSLLRAALRCSPAFCLLDSCFWSFGLLLPCFFPSPGSFLRSARPWVFPWRVVAVARLRRVL